MGCKIRPGIIVTGTFLLRSKFCSQSVILAMNHERKTEFLDDFHALECGIVINALEFWNAAVTGKCFETDHAAGG